MDRPNSVIVVVGAGIAGLYCAQKLQQAGKRVIVVEAQDYVGGRIRNQAGFVPWKEIEMGAEFIHGPNTTVKKFVDQMVWENTCVIRCFPSTEFISIPFFYDELYTGVSMSFAVHMGSR
jgi:monoamine oxidase